MKDIKIKELSKRDMERFYCSRLELEISGIDTSVINALRRLCYQDIPIYAYDSSTIDIEFNDSIYNNDMMRLRLSNLPIFNIDSDVDFLSRKYWDRVDFTDAKRDKHPKEKKIETFINVHNDTLTNMNVFSTSLKTFIDGKPIDDMYKNIEPVLLLKLRPNQAFKAKLSAVLATGELNDIYSGVSRAFHKEMGDNEFKFTIESQGQLDEYKLLVKACNIAVKKLEDVKTNVSKTLDADDKNDFVEIKLINEDRTIGNMIGDALQNHKDVIFAAPPKPDMLVKEIKIKYYTKNKDKLKVFTESVDTKIDIFKGLSKELNRLGKKYI